MTIFSEITELLTFSIVFLTLFGIAEFLYLKMKVRAEITRKFVHAGSGIVTLLFPLYLSNHWGVLLLCSLFALILFLSMKFNFLNSINAVGRSTAGTLLFALSVYLCFLLFKWQAQLIFFYIPILVLALSDPIAALVGKRWPVGKYSFAGETKTAAGSSGFFISAFLVCMTLLIFMKEGPVHILSFLAVSLAIAGATTVAEGVSIRGTDNLTVPLTAGACLVLAARFHLL